MAITLDINGSKKQVDVSDDTPLLWVLRDELQLTGTKFGCGMAQCGACTVHVNGTPQRSCVLPVEAAKNMQITTIEAINSDISQALQLAWQELDVPQCGYCQSGQIMSAVGVLTNHRKPSDEQIDNGMSGNLCRCASYGKIREAIHLAADKLAKSEA
ncbi:(2Fe-2S)-binding protein [Aliiglaciecola sp.]|nr:(2Fe-2S)-binding protein [Aliiglaciecola sp.]